MLTVIKDDQRPAGTEIIHQHLSDGNIYRFTQSQQACQCARDQFCMIQRCKVEEPNAIGKSRHDLCNNLDRQTRLAGPSRAGQRDQPRLCHQTGDFD